MQVWTLNLDRAIPTSALSAEESRRAARFARERDGLRWARSRALLRTLLAGHLNIEPRAVRFHADPHGKPRLAQTAVGGAVHFNVSHSGGMAVCAVATAIEVGVDLETEQRANRVDAIAVAERVFGREASRRLGRLDPERRRREFLRMWVRHEAQVKCVGVGLGADEESLRQARGCWTLELDLGDLALGALATRPEPTAVTCRGWEPDGSLALPPP